VCTSCGVISGIALTARPGPGARIAHSEHADELPARLEVRRRVQHARNGAGHGRYSLHREPSTHASLEPFDHHRRCSAMPPAVIAIITALAAQGVTDDRMRAHLQLARRVGIDEDALTALMTLLAVYLGYARASVCPVGGDLDRRGSRLERAGEERPRSRSVSALADQDADDLTVQVDRAVPIGPAPSDLHVRLIEEPPITRRVTYRTRGIDELRGEAPDPSVDGDVVDPDSTLGQQLLPIALGQAVAQLPTHRHRDHLPREAVAGRRGRDIPRSDHRISLSRPTTIDQRNRPTAGSIGARMVKQAPTTGLRCRGPRASFPAATPLRWSQCSLLLPCGRHERPVQPGRIRRLVR
jgi:hypothetical protein